VNGDGGFVLLTGEVGAGKTTICRCLLEQIPQACDIAYLFNPKLTVEELLSSICSELRIACPPNGASIKTFVDCINAHLLASHAKGRHTVLIIDEAQNLSADVLEQMRLLTNLETNRRKLLQIILVGQPELAELLERRELRQLAQRIVARYHLPPLTRTEISAYVQHRLEVAGAVRPLIPPALAGRLYRLSLGVPRLINVLCDRALLGAYVQGKEKVDRATLAQAAREVFYQPAPWRRRLLRFFSSRPAALRSTTEERLNTPHEVPPPSPVVTPESNVAKPAKPRARASLNTAVNSPLDAIEWPANEPRNRSRSLAFAALFNAWGVEPLEINGAPPEKTGLRCRTARGGLDDLIKLNRPAILTLRDRRGRELHATLTTLTDETATVAVGTTTRSVARRVLVKQWSGDYSMLWRLPPFAQRTIWPGQTGPEVLWLRQQLALAQGDPEKATAEPMFDDMLVNEVKQFQRERGLLPDGAIGVQTLIHLSGINDSAAPELSPSQAKK
ncbi:MAG TPA: AAA family ATPase, partial [Burkholderiales bacterium]|nr:AAA family ATPase [Burkholderiales bacterium]